MCCWTTKITRSVYKHIKNKIYVAITKNAKGMIKILRQRDNAKFNKLSALKNNAISHAIRKRIK